MPAMLLVCLLSLTFINGCKKEEPPTCVDQILNQNEKATDCGGVCIPCPCFDGYLWPLCDSLERKIFLGQYQGIEICDVDTNFYTLTISEADSVSQMRITNVFGLGFTAIADADETNFAIPLQNIGPGFDVVGQATLHADTLILIFNVNTGGDEMCVFRGRKM